MRPIIILAITILSFECKSTKIAQSSSHILNGNWLPIKEEIGGKELPSAFFKNQKLIIQDTAYFFQAESVDKGILKYGSGRMDIYGKEGVNRDKHFTAIYKLENGQLTICYNLIGDSYPSGFETSPKPTLFLTIFKKD